MKSNIALRSNVYINRTGRKTDRDFLAQVLDYKVLSEEYNERKEPSAPLSLLQRQILRNGPPVCTVCNHEAELAFGVPVGGNRFLCRCEKTACPRYADCSAADNFERIEREPEDVEPLTPPEVVDPETVTQPEDIEPETVTPPEDVEPRTTTQPEDVEPRTTTQPEDVEPETITQPEDVEPRTTTQPEDVEPRTITQSKALTQNEVIYASPNSRVWVNAGPGAGKTYTVVKRLAYLLKNDATEGAILALCFSKNAVAVISARLREEIGELMDSFIAEERLIIRTFDSFATYMLSDDLSPGLNYDQRIELFIQKFREQPDSLENISYLIVDEVQDTVGVRARMLREMLSLMNCGALLLGDRCQSIYDWSVREKGDCASVDLFRWIEKQGFQTGEMERNHRQTEKLGRLGDKMRQSLLRGDEEEQERVLDECKSALPRLKEEQLPNVLTGRNELILCKTNGEAAAVSDRFFGSGAKFVKHTVMRGAGHQSLAPWIGQILGGCTDIQIDKDAFFAQAEESEVDGVDEKWEALKALDSHPHSAVLYRREVLRRLSKLDSLPELCLNRPGAGVIVSTVHRAKGSEAERVYWLNSPLVFNNRADDPHAKTDALKASYVAVTRAKTDLRLVEPEQRYMKSVGENRWIKCGTYQRYGTQKIFCAGIAMEPDDLDCLSCVAGEKAEEIQTFLSGMESGFPLVLYPAQNESQFIFDVFFDGFCLGQTSASFAKALEAGFQETNKNKNAPASISSVYVSALTTVIRPEEPSAENIYRKSGCWLACELGGFALINYYN
ncbi:MAG: UvrD-helicase domain-containing protein [Oscillibacter sp.]|nr:UvrD-helicase domain-containing protein [Oscillibacter sp.]